MPSRNCAGFHFSACFCFYYHFSGTNFLMYVLFYPACHTYPNLCVAMATENVKCHYFRKLMPSLHHMDMPLAGLTVICHTAYSCSRSFVIKKISIMFLSNNYLVVNAPAITNTKRGVWKICFYSYTSFAADVLAATIALSN